MLRVIILRGFSGAGKSHYIKTHFPNAVVCSADDYFVNEAGEYEFKNPDIAHGKCLRKFVESIIANFDCDHEDEFLVVDNTNIRMAELAPYYQVARAYGYQAEIIRIDCDPEIAAARNKHGVPLEKIQEWAAKFEKLPPYWPAEKVVDTTPVKLDPKDWEGWEGK